MCGTFFHYTPDCHLGTGVHPLYRSYFSLGGCICPQCVLSLGRGEGSASTEPSVRDEVYRNQKRLALSPLSGRWILGFAGDSWAHA